MMRIRAIELRAGDVVGNKRALRVWRRGRAVHFLYEYRVADDDDRVRWYRQAILPGATLDCQQIIVVDRS